MRGRLGLINDLKKGSFELIITLLVIACKFIILSNFLPRIVYFTSFAGEWELQAVLIGYGYIQNYRIRSMLSIRL